MNHKLWVINSRCPKTSTFPCVHEFCHCLPDDSLFSVELLWSFINLNALFGEIWKFAVTLPLKIKNELQSMRKGARARKLLDLFGMSASSLLFSSMSKTQLENSQEQVQASATRWQQRTFMWWLQFTQSQNKKSKTCHPMLLQERMEFIFRRNF